MNVKFLNRQNMFIVLCTVSECRNSNWPVLQTRSQKNSLLLLFQFYIRVLSCWDEQVNALIWLKAISFSKLRKIGFTRKTTQLLFNGQAIKHRTCLTYTLRLNDQIMFNINQDWTTQYLHRRISHQNTTWPGISLN